jgi:hypothetical protein
MPFEGERSPMDGDGPIDQPQAFRIGLALAGAISAGAYTAGVLDFLFQALSEWENHRGRPGVPDHRVVLDVIPEHQQAQSPAL